jgi:hypothetical protein
MTHPADRQGYIFLRLSNEKACKTVFFVYNEKRNIKKRQDMTGGTPSCPYAE